MITPTYRLPDSLGGHECQIVDENNAGEVVVKLKVDGLAMTLILARHWLAKIEPEPPVGSVVWVQPLDFDPVAGIILRRYADGWTAPGEEDDPDFHDWAKVCSLSIQPPVLLIPDPAAGAATSGTWKCATGVGNVLSVTEPDDDGDVQVAIPGYKTVWLSHEDAESAGRTLLAAARQP
jgi:hypothetical protein